jgi:hypothetical protein
MSWASVPGDGIPDRADLNDGIFGSSSPPTGPTPSLSTGQETNPPGTIITASWTNVGGSTGMSIRIEWQRNGSFHSEQLLSPGSTSATLDTTGLTSGDTIRARIRYQFDGLISSTTFTGDTDVLPDGAELNSTLTLGTAMSPTDGLFSKNQVLNNTDNRGTYGSLSNTITLD